MMMRHRLFGVVLAVVPLLLLAGLLVQQVPVEAQTDANRPRKFAFLVGVKDYDNRQMGDLPNAERDITELAKELRAANYDEVIVLLSSGNAQLDGGRETNGNPFRGGTGTKDSVNATGENCRKAFEKLLARRLTKKDTLLIALAGHGMLTKPKPEATDQEPYFVPKDGVLSDPESMIAINDWLDLLDKKGAGTNMILIDACRNDPDPSRGRPGGLDGNRVRLPKDPERDANSSGGTVVFFACSKGQKAYESDKANGGIENAPGGHGVFFHFVLKGIRGEAKNEKTQKVTWDRLVSYVKEGVDQDFETLVPNKTKQVPHSIGTLAGSAEVIAAPSLLPKGLPKTLAIKLSDTETLELVLVDPLAQPDRGEFLMGSSAENIALIKKKGWPVQDDETEHKVKLTKPYYLGKYEVTRGQFSTFLNAAGEKTEAEEGDGGYGWNDDKKTHEKDKKYTWKNPGYRQEDNHPVVLVSWNDSKKFTRWMAGRAQLQQVSAKLSGRKWEFGLPSEAQWEYANRSPKQTLFAHGDDAEELANYGNVADSQFRDYLGAKRADWPGIQADDKYVFTSPVGSSHFRPNRFGIYDMTGNVWEWCEDYWGKYDDVPNRDNPIQSDKQSNEGRVLRGGAWSNYPGFCRVAARDWYAPGNRDDDNGFRVCLRLDE